MEPRPTKLSTPPAAAATSAPCWQESELRPPPRVPSSQPRDRDRPSGPGGCGRGAPLSESPGSESASLSERGEMWDGLYRAEESDLGSQETPMTLSPTTHVLIPPQAGESCKTGPTGLLSGLKPRARRWAVQSVVLNLLLIITVIIFIIIFIAWSAKKPEPCPADPTCPDGWIGYLEKCYYFSEAEGNWTHSQSHCSALGASLVAIDTQQEMDFLLRYKGPSHHWIGLRREPDQPWVWTNGTKFNNWFPIVGQGLCAFADNGDIASSGCSREGHWICSKAAEKPAGRAK